MVMLFIFLSANAQKEGNHKLINERNPAEISPMFEEYFFNGVSEMLINNYDKAVEQFQLALKENPFSDACFYNLGKCNVKLMKYTEAEKNFIQAKNIDPQNKWYYQSLADLYEAGRKYEIEGELYDEMITQFPNNSDYYISRANVFLYLNKPKDALKIYQKLEKKFGASDAVLVQEYNIYLDYGKTDDAVDIMERLIEKYPSDSRYYQMVAQAYFKAGKDEKGLEVFRRLLEKNPYDGNAQLAVADYNMKHGLIEEGVVLLKKAFQNKDVDLDSKIQILYGNYLMRNVLTEQQKKDAFELAEILVSIYPNEAKTHALYGDLLYNEKMTNAAHEQYLKSIALQNNVFAVWQQLMFCNVELKNPQRQIEESLKGLEIFPNQPLLYFFNGVAKIELKQYKEALEELKMGLNLVVDNPNLNNQFLINIAEAAYRIKDYPQSDEAFEKALEIDPKNSLTLNNYAFYLSERGDKLDLAEEMSKKSLAMKPDNSSYQDTYGWILYKKGNFEEAAVWIKKALEQETNSADVLEHYGDVQYKLNNVEEALIYWRKAKDAGSESKVLEQKINDKKLLD